MTGPRTAAGRALHDMRHLPEFCSDPCELEQEVATIETEAAEAAVHQLERAVLDRAKVAVMELRDHTASGYECVVSRDEVIALLDRLAGTGAAMLRAAGADPSLPSADDVLGILAARKAQAMD